MPLDPDLARRYGMMVALSADEPALLRRCDVSRVVWAALDDGLSGFPEWLSGLRPDLAGEVQAAVLAADPAPPVAVAEAVFRWQSAPYTAAGSAQMADVVGVGRLLVRRDGKGSRTFRVMVNGDAVAFRAPSLADGCRQAEEVARRILATRALAAAPSQT